MEIRGTEGASPALSTMKLSIFNVVILTVKVVDVWWKSILQKDAGILT